ncbi:MAG: carbohydrate kinase family protein [Candidatus Yanofskybacteria bacterium]|nr:carbohydrate kinase family protein [Candidatus Yanofskybacteria bacterium]
MFGTKKFDIITIGSATRDVFLKSEQFKIIEDKSFSTGQGECFALGSKIEIKDIVFTSGGGGTNTAVTFARQGLKTVCVGAIGDDLNGKDIVDELGREGVNTEHFQVNKDGHTAYSVILVHESGERTILSYKGEGQNFDVKEIPFDKFGASWLFLDSLGGHYDLLETAVNWAVKNKVKLATNPGGKELAHGLDKLKPLLKNFSIVIMNQEEASELVGIDYDKESEIFRAMDDIIGGVFVMTKGPEGVVVSDGKNIYRAGVPDSPVVERTGAGDAFSSGFIAEYVKSDNIKKAIQFATANASSVVSKFGAKAGILKKGDWGHWPLIKVDYFSQL